MLRGRAQRNAAQHGVLEFQPPVPSRGLLTARYSQPVYHDAHTAQNAFLNVQPWEMRLPRSVRAEILDCTSMVENTEVSVEGLVTSWKQEDTQCTYNVSQARSRNHCCRGKAISITYFECVSVAVVIQHAKRMRRIILSSVACLAVPYFSTLSHKRYDFRKKVIGHKMCVLILCTTFVWNISHCTKNSARDRHVKYLLSLSDCN
jgi:hypothetical protein